MSTFTKLTRLFAVLVVLSFIAAGALADNGEGAATVRLGYRYVDEDGHHGVNQETFNLYEGPVVSVEDFSYIMPNGIGFNGQFKDVSLNSRNLTFSTYKPGLFNATITNNQYRRVYSESGGKFTRRRYTAGSLMIRPAKAIKFFGGFKSSQKSGQTEFVTPVDDTTSYYSDFRAFGFNFGTEAIGKAGSLRGEYIGNYYFDELDSDRDRKGRTFKLDGFVRLPDYDWFTLSAGYFDRLDEIYDTPYEIQTQNYWLGTRWYLPQKWIFEYRLLMGQTDRTSDDVSTERTNHTLTLNKTWNRVGGARVGYERRQVDNSSERTVSNGFLFSGWIRPTGKLRFRARMTSRDRSMDDGYTLAGEEDYIAHRVAAIYSEPTYGNLSCEWIGKNRKRDELETEVDYNGLNGVLSVTYFKNFDFYFSYAYNVGEYTDRDDYFEFADHVLVGSVSSDYIRNLNLAVDATYYRSKRDLSIEKFAFGATVAYALPKGHTIEAKYNAFTYDDLYKVAYNYTANVVEVNIIKDLSL